MIALEEHLLSIIALIFKYCSTMYHHFKSNNLTRKQNIRKSIVIKMFSLLY